MKKRSKRIITKLDDVPVTHLEMKAVTRQISSLKISMDSRFESVDKRFDSVDKRFDSIDKRFDSVDSKFESLIAHMEAGFNRLSAEIHGIRAIVEEQNARNKVVMDAQNLFFLG